MTAPGDLPTRLRAIDGSDGDGPAVPRRSRVAEDGRRRFPIDVRQTSLPTMSGIAWRAIEASNQPPRWFAVDGRAVRLVDGINPLPRIEPLGVDTLSRLSSRTAFWYRDTKDGETEQFPLERVMRDMLADPAPPLPPLRRVLAAPVLGSDGALHLTAGYAASTGNYAATDGLAVTVPDDPSPGEIEAARALLMDELLGDFPFTGEPERAHALSLLLNPFVRDLIDGPTPLYLIEAPNAGTGKGLLAHMLALPALGGPPILMAPTRNEEETRKRLTATLVTLPEIVLLDNADQKLDSPSLAAALTAKVWTDRVLGTSESRSLRVRTTWVATGNNPAMSREIGRRVVRIRLDAGTEQPEERRAWRHPRLEQWATRERPRLIAAALTLMQAWLRAGSPRDEDAVLGSFDEWAQLHGGILAVAGVPGFLANRREARAAEGNEDDAWRQLVAAWWDEHRTSDVTISDLYPLAKEIDDFPLGRNPDERGQRSSLGRALSRNRDRVFSGYRIVRVERGDSAAHYVLRPAEETPF